MSRHPWHQERLLASAAVRLRPGVPDPWVSIPEKEQSCCICSYQQRNTGTWPVTTPIEKNGSCTAPPAVVNAQCASQLNGREATQHSSASVASLQCPSCRGERPMRQSAKRTRSNITQQHISGIVAGYGRSLPWVFGSSSGHCHALLTPGAATPTCPFSQFLGSPDGVLGRS